MKTKVAVAYCSPGGSTRHVARVIEAALAETGTEIVTLDLGDSDGEAPFIEKMGEMGPEDVLFLGSPVYRDMAVPPVMRFIAALPEKSRGRAVPFVTWGGAFSGIALWQMGQALSEKGFVLAGALKVLARHTMMWKSAPPSGGGHPDAEDDRVVSSFVGDLLERSVEEPLPPMAPDQLDYHPAEHTDGAKAKLGQPWMVIPKTVDEDACTQCGICRDECPVNAVELDPFPVIDSSCFDCFNCVRLCPEEAILPAVAYGDVEKMILHRVRTFNETPATQVFGG